MTARSLGTFVISWSQVELDGLFGASVGTVAVGSTWRWSGPATCIDDPSDVLILENAKGNAHTHRRAAKQLRRFLGGSGILSGPNTGPDGGEALFKSGFDVTDGQVVYRAVLVELGAGKSPLLLFRNGLPPQDQDLWVVTHSSMGGQLQSRQSGAVGTICFTPGTWINTPDGSVLVEDLEEGDEINTKDNGPQTIRWVGSRRVSGGRLIAMPQLRPVRVRAHVLGDGEPDADLVLSPDHRLLVKGAVSQSLFNSHEVLVAARDLINDRTILPDYRCKSVTYIHLMLDQHQVVWANGVEVESFHPAGMSPETIETGQRHALYDRFPEVESDPLNYGEYARRNLSRSEAAILTYGALGGH